MREKEIQQGGQGGEEGKEESAGCQMLMGRQGWLEECKSLGVASLTAKAPLQAMKGEEDQESDKAMWL